MITVSLQGAQISSRQRLMLEQQQHVRSFMNPVLKQQVNETLQAVQVLREEGVKPWVNPNKFNICERSEKGTLSVAEWMGY